MSEGLQAILNDDGVFEEYDDTYDLTIHCESEEEQEEVLNKLNWRWIPVSERLPEEDCETYLVCCANGYIASTMYDRYLWWLLDDEKVIAWMPLPQPYNGESEDAE